MLPGILTRLWPTSTTAASAASPDVSPHQIITALELALRCKADALTQAARDLDDCAKVLEKAGRPQPAYAARNCAIRAREAAEGWGS